MESCEFILGGIRVLSPLAFRVDQKVYNFFKTQQNKNKDHFLSDTVKKYFGLTDLDVTIDLKLDHKDKRWVSLVILAHELLKVAEIDLIVLKDANVKQGYTHVLNHVKNNRIKSEILVDTLSEMDMEIDKKVLNTMFDFAIEMSIAVEKASRSPRMMEKLKLAILNFVRA